MIIDDNDKIVDENAKTLFENLLSANLELITPNKIMEIYNDAVKVQEEKKKKDQEKKRLIQKLEEQYKGIRVSLGVPWVSVNIVKDFMTELLKLPPYITNSISYNEYLCRWTVYKCKELSALNEHVYGTRRYPALRIFEAILNCREIVVMDGCFLNEEETIAAIEKQKLIVQKFEEWVWQSDDRKYEILTAYHRMFADFKIDNGENISLSLEGMNDRFRLHDFQKKAIKRIVANKNTLLAFEVGSGKTYIMIASAMEMRAKGISKKNMFVVPNNIVGQWQRMFLELYPNANILVVEPKTFAPKNRKSILIDMHDNDYDGIIIAYSCFEMIAVSYESEIILLTKKLEKIQRGLEYGSRGMYELRGEKDRILKAIHEIKLEYEDKDEPKFDELNINTLFVDEAHNFKNIPIEANLHGVRGVNPNGSQKCKDMLTKVRIVQMQNEGRGVVFATGTPLSNSISDAYMLQNYLQLDRLEMCGLDNFINWVKTFAKIESNLEIAVDSNSFRMTRRFTKFFNLPELSKMFAEVAIFHSNTLDGIPDDCKYVDHTIKSSEEFKIYMKRLGTRADYVKQGRVSPKIDNMLKISTDGRKSALDLTLVGVHQPNNKGSKVFSCVNTVFDLYREFPESSQIIFCDFSTPKGEDFSVYQKIKQQLIDKGVDSSEIEFVHNAKTEIAKQKLFDDVNCGKIRVLIGSTFKLGIGANVQTRLKAIHHLDVPWRPADMVQREGRILRQGNSNKEVLIFRYILEGSFDAYCWQILETKQVFISQFLSNTSREREMSDLEENVLNYAEVKSLALAKPLMKVLIAKENEVRNAQIVLMKNIESREQLKEKIEWCEEEIIRLGNYIEKCKDLSKDIAEYDLTEIKKILSDNVSYLLPSKIAIEPGAELFEILDFRVKAPVVLNEKRPILILSFKDMEFEVDIGESAVGNITRLLHFFGKFGTYIEKQEEKLQDLKENKYQCAQQYNNIDISDMAVKRLIAERDSIAEQVFNTESVDMGVPF
ncbi:MAG: hypothetical protein E7354_00175 [Clostridiales bacterium]|nr:hypothetical protein [Clostridiales bacterium]